MLTITTGITTETPEFQDGTWERKDEEKVWPTERNRELKGNAEKGKRRQGDKIEINLHSMLK